MRNDDGHLSAYSFSEFLISKCILSEKAAKEAEDLSQQTDEPLAYYLEKKGLLSSSDIALHLSNCFSIPLYDLDEHDINSIPKDLLSCELFEKNYGLPLDKKGNELLVAVGSPNLSQLHDLEFITGYEIKKVIVEINKLNKIISQLKEQDEDFSFIDSDEDDSEDFEIDTYDEDAESQEDLMALNIDDRPVVRFVNKILLGAVMKNASDIHFEPYEEKYRVRYRQDGVLNEIAAPPSQYAGSITARIKVLANLDISERRIPQDGRFKLKLSKERVFDLRISTCPTLWGEKIVMRLLDGSHSSLDIATLGMDKDQLHLFQSAIGLSQGMVLVTGPTGSGKTISLYSALKQLNIPEKNISTIEDPIEINMQGINQVQVNNKTGMKFSNALRSFLRQDPDIIMVGEIRDLETADIAIKAAQTGHLVFSTLHTNTAPETISRLINIGVKPYNIISSLSLVVAQRLVRVLCEHCKIEHELSEEDLIILQTDINEAKPYTIYEPGSCEKCLNGFNGRTGIYEIMPLSIKIKKLILASEGAIQITEQARAEGVKSLYESAIDKVLHGVTSIDEIKRVVSM